MSDKEKAKEIEKVRKENRFNEQIYGWGVEKLEKKEQERDVYIHKW